MDTEVDSGEFAASGDEFVRSELLCFLQNKSSLIPHDQLVKIYVDFYTKEEAATARQLIERYLSSGSPVRLFTKDTSYIVTYLFSRDINIPSCTD